jgi:hypothetical protein
MTSIENNLTLTLTQIQVRDLIAIVEAQTENLRTVRASSYSGVDQFMYDSAILSCETLATALRSQVPAAEEPVVIESPEA